VNVLVVGGGPGGSSTAIHLAEAGHQVTVVDRARFPRPKPCGDGITPRGVALLTALGIGSDASAYHRVDGVRLCVGAREVIHGWPQGRVGLPGVAWVCSRDVLDTDLLQRANRAGATVMQHTEFVRPLWDGEVMCGAYLRTASGREFAHRADVTVAADGATSRVARAAGLGPASTSIYGVAVRAEVTGALDRDDLLNVFPRIRSNRGFVPGYGWVFPMGAGRYNVGVGYASTARDFRRVRISEMFDDFARSLPRRWAFGSPDQWRREGLVHGWRLPMGFSAWPPWRPGVLAVGDAIGAAKPFTGAGISKALQCGAFAAEAIADAERSGCGPENLSAYEDLLAAEWGAYYALGRRFVKWMARGHAIPVLTAASHLPPLRNSMGQVFSQSYVGRVTTAAARGLQSVAVRREELGMSSGLDRGRRGAERLREFASSRGR
jgi:geranylgeranyl reductase family protein